MDHYLFAEDPVILVHEHPLVNDLFLKELGISRIFDIYLAHHLPDNDLEVFVIDLNTLHPVHFLYLIDNVLLHLGRSLDGQDVSRCNGPIRQGYAGLYVIILLDQDLLGQGYQVFLQFFGLGLDNYLTVTPLDLPEGYFSVNFRNDCRI